MVTARKVSSDLQVKVQTDSVEEWRFVMMTSGGQCVMMDGM